jgi:hypothetical protein
MKIQMEDLTNRHDGMSAVKIFYNFRNNKRVHKAVRTNHLIFPVNHALEAIFFSILISQN